MPTASEHHRTRVADAPTFANRTARDVVSCRVCGRTLLIGERSIGYFTASGEGPYDVCELCVPRAHRYGLTSRQASPDEIARARRGGPAAHLTAWMRNLISGRRASGAATGATQRARTRPAPAGRATHGTAAVAAAAAAAPDRSRPFSALRARRAAAAAPLDPAALGAVPVGAAAVPIAIAAFNQSPHARTLAGLYRTLGTPRASARPRTSTDREVILTVAWEIVWYQFRVMPDGIEQQSGQYLGELDARWQRWNCTVAADGTIRPRDEAMPSASPDALRPARHETEGSIR